MKDLRRFTALFARYRWKLAASAVLLAVVSAIGLVLPWSVQRLVDEVFAERNAAFLNQISLALVALIAVQSFLHGGLSYLLSYVGEHVVADVRSNIFRKLQQLDLRFFELRRVGEITSRMTSDVTAVQSLVTTHVVTAFHQALVCVGALVMVFYVNARLAAAMLVIVAPIMLTARYFGRRLRGTSTKVQDKLAEANAVLDETVAGVRVVKSFVREEHEIGRFSTAIANTLAAAMARARFRAAFVPLINSCAFGGLVFVLWYGGRQVLAGDITPGQLVSFLFYSFMIAGAIGSFASLYGQFQESLGALHRVFELLDTSPQVTDAPHAAPLPRIAGHVRFDDVTFAYETEPVLRDIALDVAPGEVVALVGPSGAGKTTLFNLLLRFYDPTAGRITIDGHDLREVTAASLREQISVVPQETLLFSMSVRDNIRYGRLDASEEEIVAAAQAANAHSFIAALAEGYDTRVGERGVNLSGGERQRLAMARAFLKNPRILLLDEATSALDSESEGLVQEALARLMRGKTTFIIAHRLATVQIADRIVVLDKGRIVDVGTHEELLARGGLYAHLYALQFKSPENDVAARGDVRRLASDAATPATVLDANLSEALFPVPVNGPG